jgi:hypothetical protein
MKNDVYHNRDLSLVIWTLKNLQFQTNCHNYKPSVCYRNSLDLLIILVDYRLL